MKVAAIIASVLMISATSAMAEGTDCAAKSSASLKRPQTTASIERIADDTAAVSVMIRNISRVNAPVPVTQ